MRIFKRDLKKMENQNLEQPSQIIVQNPSLNANQGKKGLPSVGKRSKRIFLILIALIIGVILIIILISNIQNGSKNKPADTNTTPNNQTSTQSPKPIPADLQNLNTQIEQAEKNLLDPYQDESKLNPPLVDLKVEF
ncbi:MAG TPA: hypothetical protein VIK81_03890 [Patescibacteria group bacterium]